jgi:hypothetical protein
MAEDWRVHARLSEQDNAAALVERLEAMDLAHDVMERLGARIVVSRDGPDVFLYADTEDAAREAERVLRSLLEDHGYEGDLDVRRWHPDAEEWKPADVPLPATEEEREAERRELMEREAAESTAEGFPEWEVRIELPHRHDAVELEKQLRAEGLQCTRRWRFLFVGALSEEEADELAGRLRGEAPAGSNVSVEGTFEAVRSRVPNPFAFLGGLGN